MKKLDPHFIDVLAMEVSRLSRAIQSLQKLDEHLPPGFPPPCAVKASRKPFDLAIEWEPATAKQGVALVRQLDRVFGVPETAWGREEHHHLAYHNRFKLNGKNSLNLLLRIKIPVSTE